MRKQVDERGQAVLETFIAVPIILLFLLALCDVGRYVLIWTSIEQASTAVSEQYVDTSILLTSKVQIEANAKSAALSASPNLDAGKLTVTLDAKTSSSETYTHHLTSLENPSAFKSEKKTLATRQVKYTITYKDEWMTPIGKAVNMLQGTSGDAFTIAITKTRQYDVSTTNGVW